MLPDIKDMIMSKQERELLKLSQEAAIEATRIQAEQLKTAQAQLKLMEQLVLACLDMLQSQAMGMNRLCASMEIIASKIGGI